MNTSMSKKRVKRVFDRCSKNIKEGKKPNVSGEMRKEGYSEYSSKSLKVKDTKAWKELLAEVNDGEILDTFKEIMRDKSGKRERLEAAKELAKLKDHYPDKKHKVSVYNEREQIVE